MELPRRRLRSLGRRCPALLFFPKEPPDCTGLCTGRGAGTAPMLQLRKRNGKLAMAPLAGAA
eukprot:scaffold462_cov195-Pinguiococcus_pyrenoidosus.AAC.19